jgi:hypothetical protein
LEIGALVRNSSTQVVPFAPDTELNADTEEWDTHSFWSGGTPSRMVFTTGGIGKYIVSYSCTVTVAFSQDQTPTPITTGVFRFSSAGLIMYGSKDCKNVWRFSATVGTGSQMVQQNTICLQGTTIVDITAAGQSIAVEMSHFISTDTVTATDFVFSVHKVNRAGAL